MWKQEPQLTILPQFLTRLLLPSIRSPVSPAITSHCLMPQTQLHTQP